MANKTKGDGGSFCKAMLGMTRPPLAGLKLAMLPFTSENGGCTSQRKPKLKVRLLDTCHSSCAKTAKCFDFCERYGPVINC
jgi:hypothetical protein